ncbi:hypothetical protein [Caviibacterium pharyngocola]|uniref:Uncharacterized protein n=1 Tax=Caviibacterium pharyngocola TaxID=28159 RepID=A0A2M8RTV3_9PAST|nr:hypothetical protein [Caviibacterium pharyngocola]PJG82321.1 hypothetical protein CVP04_09845 [Caviibacterium pharyngocola]
MIYELRTKLNYKIRYTTINTNPIEISVIVTPDFNGYNQGGNECTVFDFLALYEKMDKNSSYYPITCECGFPDDAGIYAPISQKLTETEIYWDIPITDYPYTLSPEYSKLENGTLRIIFNKQQYQQTTKQIVTLLKSFIESGIEISTIKAEDFISVYSGANYFTEVINPLIIQNTQLTHIKLHELHPYGGIDIEKIFD